MTLRLVPIDVDAIDAAATPHPRVAGCPVVEGAQPVPWAAFRIVVDFATADGMTSRVETLRLGKAVTR